jgi:hypothetical protein
LFFYDRAPPGTETIARADVIEAHCQPDFADNPFGKVKPGAFLVLRGPLLRCAYSDISQAFADNNILRPLGASIWPAELDIAFHSMDSPMMNVVLENGTMSLRRSPEPPDNSDYVVSESQVDVLVLTMSYHANRVEGILLAPHHCKQGGYQRIGYVRLGMDSSLSVSWDCLRHWVTEVTEF